MQPTEFIYTNVRKALIAKGFSEDVSSKSAEKAERMYKEVSCMPSGGLYEFLLKEAIKSAKDNENAK